MGVFLTTTIDAQDILCYLAMSALLGLDVKFTRVNAHYTKGGTMSFSLFCSPDPRVGKEFELTLLIDGYANGVGDKFEISSSSKAILFNNFVESVTTVDLRGCSEVKFTSISGFTSEGSHELVIREHLNPCVLASISVAVQPAVVPTAVGKTVEVETTEKVDRTPATPPSRWQSFCEGARGLLGLKTVGYAVMLTLVAFIIGLGYASFKIPRSVMNDISENGASSGVPELPQIQKPPTPAEETLKEWLKPKVDEGKANEPTTPPPPAPVVEKTDPPAKVEEEEAPNPTSDSPPAPEPTKKKMKRPKTRFMNEWPGH